MRAVKFGIYALFALVLGLTTTAALAQHAPAPPTDQGEGDHAAAPHDDAHAEGHDEHGEHAIKGINWADFGNKEQPPYVSQLINFAALLAIFYIFGKKPITEGLAARRASVAKEIEEAQRMKAEAEARAKMYRAKIDGLEEELATMKAGLIEAGKGERDRIIREAEEKATRMARDAKEQIEQESKQMQQDLVRETVEIAMAAAAEMLKQKITPADHERLADEYLATLGKPSAASVNTPRGAS